MRELELRGAHRPGVDDRDPRRDAERQPCFAGTRIAFYDVLDHLASGMTADQVILDFPELEEKHVRAAMHFAAMRERRLATPT